MAVHFRPYEGANYRAGAASLGNMNAGGMTILLVGESHYSNDNKTLQTIEVLKNVQQGLWHFRFTTMACRLFFVPEQPKPGDFWSTVAFYNYIQRMLPHSGRPNKQDWSNAAPAFIRVLQDLWPEFVHSIIPVLSAATRFFCLCGLRELGDVGLACGRQCGDHLMALFADQVAMGVGNLLD